MQAKYRGQLVEVWKISHRPIRETWVRHAFEQERLSWNEWNKNVLNFESISGDLALVGDFLIQKTEEDFMLSAEKMFSGIWSLSILKQIIKLKIKGYEIAWLKLSFIDLLSVNDY